MKKKILIIATFIAFTLTFSAAQGVEQAQSASDAMTKSRDREKNAKLAFNDGFYTEAVTLADEAAAYAQLAKNWFRANGLLKQAEGRIILAIRYKIDSREPQLYAVANEFYTQANNEYKTQQFEPSMNYSLQVIEKLKDIMPLPVPVGAQKSDAEKTYTVQNKVPAECFWRIAGYAEIYGDPAKWPQIYEANKQKLQNPNNPDLIQPGMIFAIPPMEH